MLYCSFVASGFYCPQPLCFLSFVLINLINTQLCLIQLYVVCSYKVLKKQLYFENKIIFEKKNAIVMLSRYLCIKNVIEETS